MKIEDRTLCAPAATARSLLLPSDMATNSSNSTRSVTTTLRPAGIAPWSAFALSLCFGCGASQAPASASRPPAHASSQSELPPAASALSPLTSRAAMQLHFVYATAARDAVIAGRLDGVQQPLTALAKAQPSSDMSNDWLPWLQDMQVTAQEGARSNTLGQAAQSIATLATACGECHRTTGGGQHRASDSAQNYASEDKRGLSEKMARHQFSADALWMGLVGPDHKAWSAGAAALMNISVPGLADVHGAPAGEDRRASGAGSLQGKVDPRLPAADAATAEAQRGNVDLDVAMRDLRELGARADQAKTAHEKQVIYAQLITRCGDCHSALKLAIPGKHRRVEITADKLVITEKIQFDFDTATIKPESYPLLQEIAEAINSHPRLRKISIEGHTDSAGEAAYNLKLSKNRAAAVLAHLTQQAVDAQRLTATGFGEERPIATNDNAEGMEANRRVEFIITEQDMPKRTYEIDPATRRGQLLEERSTQQP